MNRSARFVALLAVMAVLDGWLLSHLNVIGRLGVSLLHTEYRFLQTWWKGALLVFAVWLVLLGFHRLFNRLQPGRARLLHAVGLLVAVLGLWMTYQDFRGNFSHRIVGERFHLGGYLFLCGWMLIAIRSLLGIDKEKTSADLSPQDKTATFVDK